MTSSLSLPKVVPVHSPCRSFRQTALGVVAAGCLVVLTGCGASDRYAEDMTYGVRTDPLVTEAPTETPKDPDPPGDLNKLLSIPVIKENKGKAICPDLPADQHQKLQDGLAKMFGTPANPKVGGVEDEVRTALHLDEATLQDGSRLYRRHCLHCHGLTGDGHGPTAAWVNPHPRDYRQGIFKFTSSSQPSGARKPRRADLVRTIRQGLDGTAMPSFSLLSDDEVEKIISYVIHLSLRGQVEFDTIKAIKDGNLEGSIAEALDERVKAFGDTWQQAEGMVINPGQFTGFASNDARFASVRRGYELFRTGAASCISCHKDFGRANEYRFEVWGTIGRPADLTRGIYRGGRRPVDLYWRIQGGIAGTAMPSFETLPPEQVWQMVSFVQALPYPRMLPPDVRQEIYGPLPGDNETRTALAP